MLKIRINHKQFKAHLARAKSKYRAMAKTLKTKGYGEVIPSMRKKRRALDGRAKALHGRVIINIMRKRGYHVMAADDDTWQAALDRLSTGVDAALSRAFERSQSQEIYMREVLKEAAEVLVEGVKQRIISGGLGRGDAALRKRKMRLVERGLIDPKYGVPPPIGIKSGRLIEGLRARYKRGK